MSSYYNNHLWQLRELQKTLEAIRPQLDQIQAVPQAVLDEIAQINKLQEQFTFPADYLTAVDDIQKAVQDSLAFGDLKDLGELQNPAFEKLLSDLSVLDGIGATIELSEPISSMIADSLAPAEALLRTGRIAAEEIDALLVPQRAFQQFARQMDTIVEQSSRFAAEFRGSLVRGSSGLLEDMVRGLELGALMRQEAQPVGVAFEPPFEQVLLKNNHFARLEARFKEIDSEDVEVDGDELVEESCESRLADLGYHLVRLVHDLNEEAERGGEEVPFKPTTRTLHASAAITWVSASDSTSFNVVVDHLYFLLYEGTGEAKRLIEKWGDRWLDALWLLKHLRLNARHDVNHGKKRGVEAKNRKIGEAFKGLIGAVTPKTEADWCRAQVALYEQLIEMLEKLWYGDDDEDAGNSSEPSAQADG